MRARAVGSWSWVAGAVGTAVVCGMPASTAAQTAAADVPGAARLTVEGCLTREGGAERSSAAEQFVLTVKTPPGEAARTAPGGADAASNGAKAPAPPHARMYVLRSAPEAPRSFNTMIDHHVRVTGTTTAAATTAPLAGRSPEATPYEAPVATPSAGASAPTPTGTAFDTANLPTLVVHGITSVASRCK